MPPSYCFGHQHHQQPQPETQIVISSIHSIHMRSASGYSFCFRMNGELFYSPHDIHGQTTIHHNQKTRKSQHSHSKWNPHCTTNICDWTAEIKCEIKTLDSQMESHSWFCVSIGVWLPACLSPTTWTCTNRSIDGLCIDSPPHLFHFAGRGEPPVGVGDPCAGCNKPILDKFLLNVLERGWHASCVRCCECLQPLTDKCFSRESKLYCRNDFYRWVAIEGMPWYECDRPALIDSIGLCLCL